MSDNIQFSDEFINAYLDDELSHADKINLLKAAREDEELNRRLCQLQRVRNMVQLAYQDVAPENEQAQPQSTTQTQGRRYYAAAASILLLVGVCGGWFAHTYVFNKPGLTEIVQELRTNKSPSAGTPWKLMIQVSSNDQHRFNVLMNETERLLKVAQKNNEQVVIQILANSKGINFLKDDNSARSMRVRSLSKKYTNLILTACGQTLQKLKLANKKIPPLLKETRVVRSALHEAIAKQKQGWTYIKI